jgi:hypothetical protein
VIGFVDGALAAGNEIQFVATSSAEILEGLAALDISGSSFVPTAVAGLLIGGALAGGPTLEGNTVSADLVDPVDGVPTVYGVYVSITPPSSGFGTLLEEIAFVGNFFGPGVDFETLFLGGPGSDNIVLPLEQRDLVVIQTDHASTTDTILNFQLPEATIGGDLLFFLGQGLGLVELPPIGSLDDADVLEAYVDLLPTVSVDGFSSIVVIGSDGSDTAIFLTNEQEGLDRLAYLPDVTGIPLSAFLGVDIITPESFPT